MVLRLVGLFIGFSAVAVTILLVWNVASVLTAVIVPVMAAVVVVVVKITSKMVASLRLIAVQVACTAALSRTIMRVAVGRVFVLITRL